MAMKIRTNAQYKAAMQRIEELLPLTSDETPADDPNMQELDALSDAVEEYEKIHYPIAGE